MKKELIIVKIGGSIVTYKDKTEEPTPRSDVIRQLAKELSIYLKAHKENFIPHLSPPKGEGFILVHGAGSFGHPLAKRYKLAEVQNKNKNNVGAARTHCSVQQLNLFIADIFLKAECPVFPLSPLCLIKQKNGRISSFYYRAIRSLLDKGLIPLLHGDVVLDSVLQFSICSGDQIVSYLTSVFFPKRVLFLSDVDGIFTHNPRENPKAELIKEIAKKDLTKISCQTKNKQRLDVSGEMQGKLKEIAKIPCPGQIINGLKKGNFLRALQGEKIGTIIF